MNAHGRSGPPQLPWALLVIAAALVGGLAAAALVHTNLVVAVIVAVVAGVIAVAVFRAPGRSAAERDQPPAGRLRPVPPAAAPAAPPAPAAPAPAAGPAGTAVQLLPLPPQPRANSTRQAAAQSWWDAAQGAPPRPSAGAQRAPAPDLSTYLASTFIAQCPRCGAFRLDITPAASGWDFRCESCEYAWTWQPGTPWPPVRVMPGRRRP